MILKKCMVFFLSFLLILSTTARAASPAGWSASAADTFMAGATATITAFKNSGGNAVKSVIAHKPTAVAVGKEIIKGGGVLAVAYAMSKLLEAGVDWVLDPENNRVKYKNPEAPALGDAAGTGMECRRSTWMAASDVIAICAKSSLVTNPASCKFLPNSGSGGRGSITSSAGDWSTDCRVASDWTGSTGADEYKYIPIDTVAAEVIAGAEEGHAASQDFVKAVAVGQANAGDLDTALEAVAEPTTDTANPDAPPADPTKPFDDSGILAALKKILSALGLLSVLGTISDSLGAMLNFFKAEPEAEDTEIDIDVPDLPQPDTDINFGGQCPAAFDFKGSIFGNSFTITLLDTPKFCSFLGTFVKWPVYALSSLYALYIIGGRRDE